MASVTGSKGRLAASHFHPASGSIMSAKAVLGTKRVRDPEMGPVMKHRTRALGSTKSMSQKAPGEDSSNGSKPWDDEGTLRHLYVGEEMSCASIGDKLGCSSTTIRNRLHSFDIPVRGRGGRDPNAPWNDEETVRHLYEECEMSQTQVADELGCTRSKIRSSMDRFGIEPRTGGGGPWADEGALYELYHGQGLSLAEVAEELDKPVGTIYHWMKQHGIERRDRNPGSDEWHIDESVLEELYVEEQLTASKVAKRVGCSPTPVKAALKKSDIEARGRGGTARLKPWYDDSVLRRLYHEKGLSQSEVADRLGCTRKQVRHGMKTTGVEPRTGPLDLYDDRPWDDEEEMRRLHHEEELPLAEIARRFGCTGPTIRHWMGKFGIEIYRYVPSGEGHYRWKDGRCRYYGPNWDIQRQKALERDSEKCRRCGMSLEDHRTIYGCGLPVHHIRPRSSFDDLEVADRLDNLIVLCSSCHGRLDGLPMSQQSL